MVQQSPPAYGWQQPVEPAGPAPGIHFAGHGARLMAYLIDTVVLFALIMLLLVVLGGIALGAARAESFGLAAGGFFLWILAVLVISVAYFPFFWWRGGQTPGMRVFRLRVVRDVDGGPISGSQAALRLLGYWINGIALYIGFAWVLVDARRRGWHDLIAQTVVIEDPR